MAYSQHHQRQFDKRRLGWGVQWEIARLYSCGKLNWEDIVIPSLDHLVGSNAVAATKVSLDVLLGKTDVGQSGPPVRSPRRAVYEELDREQESLRAGDLLRLGALDGSPQGWFGGRVQQKMALFLRPNIPADRPFEERVIFRLLPQENGPSRRFGRYFGSRRILQLKVPKDIVNKHQSDLERYLVKAFVLLGRVFRAFSAKEHKVYFFETDEPYDGRKNIELEGDHERVSFKDFIWLHNKLDPQSSQVSFLRLVDAKSLGIYTHHGTQMMSKWSSRFSLGLSSSEPGLRFDHAHVIKDRDIRKIYAVFKPIYSPYKPHSVSSSFTGTGKPLPEEDMTDGCGLINSAALKALCRVMTLDHAPIAVQARIMGAKGLWLLHPTDRDVQPKIWLRPSQIKIGMQWTEDGTLDPHPSCLQDPVIDILRKGRFKTEVRLSKQSIICLSYGGVPSTVFFKLLEAGLERKVAPLLDWATPVGIKQLWFAIYEAGNLRDAKLRQAAGGLARSRGHVVDFDDTESAEEDILSDATTGGHWVDEKSGPPMSLHGLAMELLESGFRPVNTPILRKKLEWVVKGAVNDHIGNFNIPVPMSLQAWIAPG